MRFLDSAIRECGSQDLTIVDLGGTRSFWEMNLPQIKQAGSIKKIDILNLEVEAEVISCAEGVEIREMPADVTRLPQISDREYDIAFSNSVLEHVGNLYMQNCFSGEIRRVARRYIMQTPNRHFVLEPHFYMPFFPYLPLGMRSWLHQHFRLGWFDPEPDPLRARIDCDQIRLLNRKELRLLFPDAEIHTERLFGMIKSYVLTGRDD